jgi:GNAT superfamily N-acetyltransferase
MLIRPFVDSDYAVVTALHNANYPDFTKAVEEFRDRDSKYPESCRLARWVAEIDDAAIGFVEYHQSPWAYNPRKFSLELAVDPSHYGRGITTRLYNHVIEALRAFDPIQVDAWSRADMRGMIEFLEGRGFISDMQLFTSELDLRTFAPEIWLDRVASVEGQGIQLRSLQELGPSDPLVRRQIYDLWQAVRYDVPAAPGDERTEVSFEQYWNRMETPHFFAAGFFLAIDNGRYVGTTHVYGSSRSGQLRTGLTAVHRDYRRRGIALGMKVHALSFGKAEGYQSVVTDNASTNEGMLAINRELGFVKNPPWQHYVKTFGGGGATSTALAASLRSG